MSGKLVLGGAAVLLLIAAHLLGLAFLARRLSLPAAVVAVVAALAAAKGLVMLTPLAAWRRRRGRDPG